MLNRLSFRAKLLLVLFVPFLALVVVAAAGLSDRFSSLHAQQQYGELSAPLRSLDQASRALQSESVVSSWYIAGKGAPNHELDAARARTDSALRQFRDDEQAFLEAGVNSGALAALDNTNRALAGIENEREKIDALSIPAAAARQSFLSADDDLLEFGQRVARDLADPATAASVTRIFSLERAQHELARGAGVYIAVLASDTPDGFAEWVSATSAQADALTAFVTTASPDELTAYNGVVRGSPPLSSPASALPSAFPQATTAPSTYDASYREGSRTLDRAITAVEAVVHHVSAVSASDAQRETRFYGGAAVFAMLLTLLLIWWVSKTVVAPVRRLTDAARDMSERRLPALVESLRTGGDISALQPTPIDVESEDEVGELAKAFNDVEAVATEVAKEQSSLLRKGMSDLFVNLARRNQSLLERQLELLDDLERNEHDPSALDALFKLDHMATRMRRNAESLLVLSGAEQPRQWQQPIALLDVVRAAAGEIADFPRVEFVGIDADLAVVGRAVADIAHLVAELLENATSFSPPDAAVVVSGAATATGFVLAVSDQGIGMAPERIAAANELLARPPVVGLALSRALGLHVVGSLAARHGIAVELRAGSPLGLVALVTIPTTIVGRRAAPEAQAPGPAAAVYAPAVGDDGNPEPLGARRVAWRPPDEPPVEEWQAGLATSESPPAAPPGDDPPSGAPPRDEPEDATLPGDIPLPTRVPGRHLLHEPTASPSGTDAAADADPLRPYRVHELLTRHAQGKKRGQSRDGVPPSAHEELSGSDANRREESS